jgi:hypothetical protein
VTASRSSDGTTAAVARRRFCVPYNGDPSLVERVLRQHGDSVYEFYGSDGQFQGGRVVRPGGDPRLEQVLAALRKTEVQFNYVLNSLVLDEYLLEEERLCRHLEWLQGIGVTWITLSSPYFLERVKAFGFRAATSLLQDVRCEDTARIYRDLGFDRIIIGEEETRNFTLISALADSLRVPIEIIVNNCCLRNCPFRLTHYNAEGSSRLLARPEVIKQVSTFCRRQCRTLWYTDPRLFLKSSWTRPEELPFYMDAGVHLFKLTGRTFTSDRILKMLDVYATHAYSGNVFDYLVPDPDAGAEYGLLPISNEALGPYFAFFREERCTGRCARCRHCETWAGTLGRAPGHWRGTHTDWRSRPGSGPAAGPSRPLAPPRPPAAEQR